MSDTSTTVQAPPRQTAPAKSGIGRGPIIAIVIALLAIAGTAWVWVAVPYYSGGHGMPGVKDFFPEALLSISGSDPISGNEPITVIDRIFIVRIVAIATLLAVFIVAARRLTLVPGRFQAALEWILVFVRNNIVNEVLGEKLGKKYFNIIATIFLTVLALNITGVVPFLNIAGSSRIAIPLMFALWVFVLYIGASVKKFGVFGFLKVATMPPGVPAVLYVLLIPVEFLQTFILRPATLTIRLLANMIAGHLLLALCFFATHEFLFYATHNYQYAMWILTFAGGAFFFALEVFVAALQAYVFAILTAIYLQMVVDPEH
ncbi:MAG: F0F1 ATP synthase subunit A [Micrococcales bacterium]|nr:F0F1 ATP synthase subunit A [Micrococcales bacterium]MCL2668176.1 F0F1 ATP synthase subunit A [Micrococcales bacterium]